MLSLQASHWLWDHMISFQASNCPPASANLPTLPIPPTTCWVVPAFRSGLAPHRALNTWSCSELDVFRIKRVPDCHHILFQIVPA